MPFTVQSTSLSEWPGRDCRPGFDEEGLKMDAVAGIGGFIELLRSWQSGYLEVDARRIAEAFARKA